MDRDCFGGYIAIGLVNSTESGITASECDWVGAQGNKDLRPSPPLGSSDFDFMAGWLRIKAWWVMINTHYLTEHQQGDVDDN